MKKCKVCKEDKPLSEFYSNGLWKGVKKYKPSCKHCEYRVDQIRFIGIIKDFYKGLSCKICGFDKSFAAMDLHHRDPSEKEYTPSKMRNYSRESIEKELSKCDLLCSNCHREIHNTFGELV